MRPFFRKINLNYFKQSITKDTDIGSIPLFNLIYTLKELSSEWVRTNNIEPVNLINNNLLICCSIVLRFSFNNKL
jgi:hypothetical protein